jgi:DNA-binding NarL/FixJ family response regulator
MARGNFMRVAICSREGLFGEALASLLDHEGHYQVVATEAEPRSLVSAAKDNRAQILIVDAFQLDKDDLQFLLGARAFGDFGVVLVVPSHEKETFADIAVDRLIGREDSASDLFGALEDLGGLPNISRSYVREARRTYGAGNDLTRREFEVAQLVAKGMSNRKISQLTGLREQSIKNLVSVIMRKLHCENRVQVALKLTKVGIDTSASAE